MRNNLQPEVLIIIAIGFIFGFVALQIFLFALFYREQVKKDLRAKAYRPIHIRWRLSLLEGPNRYGSTRFSVVYSDWYGLIHTASCIVYRPPLENPFWGSLCVKWLTDTVTGRETPEVQVESEIIRPKLKTWDDSSAAKDLPKE